MSSVNWTIPFGSFFVFNYDTVALRAFCHPFHLADRCSGLVCPMNEVGLYGGL